MFSYFDTQTINSQTVVDVWKKFQIDVDSEDYTNHDLVDGDNLMMISYKYYNNIDDWWVIYIYNELLNSNFSLLQTSTIRSTVDKHSEDVNNYDNLSRSRKKYINASLRDYFINRGFSIKESIGEMRNFLIDVDSDTLTQYLSYIENIIISESFYNEKLKIPNSKVVFDIKNQLEELSQSWSA